MSQSASLLRAFRHPLIIFSILALLINDHILKASIPSWWTGKLSDFAGLFFFPFLLGAVIQSAAGIIQRLARLRAKRVENRFRSGPFHPSASAFFAGGTFRSPSNIYFACGILLTALVFTTIKTLPVANAFAAQFLSRLLHAPARFVLDPTDLAALLALIPAWSLWRHIQLNRPAARPDKLAYAALSLGALASLATAPCPTVASIQRLAVSGEMLYASVSLYPGQPLQGAYASRDQGKTWTWETQLPQEISQNLSQPVALPRTLCDPAAASTCYRIDGHAWVEESRDGGKTWQVAWKVPVERERFIRRAAQRSYLLACGKTVDLGTFDMVLLSGDAGSKLMVAMGNEGFLTHTSSAGWQRAEMLVDDNGSRAPYNPAPTPFTARSFSEAFLNSLPEWLLSLAAGLLAYLGLSLWAWLYAADHAWPAAAHKKSWAFRPAAILVPWILLLAIAWCGFGTPLLPLQIRGWINVIWIFAALLTPGILLILSVVLWRRAGALSPRPPAFSRLGWFALLLGAAVFTTTWTGFLLWAFGVIPAYEFALAAVIVSGVAVLAAGSTWMLKAMRGALAS